MAYNKRYILVLIIIVSVSGLLVTLTNHVLELSISHITGYLSESKLPADEPMKVTKNVNDGHLSQTQTEITKFIYDHGYLLPPASANVQYNLTTGPGKDPSMGQSRVVRNILNYARNGFFIECGALDGETRSNTLVLERDYNWTGLLIEGDPSNFELIQTKHRKAWTANCCVSIHPFPHTAEYKKDFNTGRISSSNNSKSMKVETTNNATQKGKLVHVQCFPLFSLLSAMHVTTVDYFSLDVEGHELEVLETIPFDLIKIKVLSVEFIHGKGGANTLETFMKSKGYRVITRVTEPNWLANDLIFAHESIEVTRVFPQEITVRGSELFEKLKFL